MPGARKPARFYAHLSDIHKRDVMEDRRKLQASSRSKYVHHDPQAGTKTGGWLISVDDLARELKTTPEHIKLIAGRNGGVTLSWVSTKGDCISRHELPAWRRVVEEDKRQ